MKWRQNCRSTVTSDVEVVVKIQLLQGNFKEALDLVAGQPDPRLMYRHAQDFFDHIPQDFVRALCRMPAAQPAKLMPVFFKCSMSNEHVSFEVVVCCV